MTQKTPADRHRKAFELFALRLEAYGPTAVTLPVVRRLASTEVWLELRMLLREHGFTEAEIAYLMDVHPPGCPCWKCAWGLYLEVRDHLTRLKHKEKAATSRKRQRLG
jgi:hypothetical protein